MTLIDVLAAFEEGAYPTNQQILAVLDYLLDSALLSNEAAAHAVRLHESQPRGHQGKTVFDRRDLSPETLDLLDEFSGLIVSVQALIKERNPNEEVQQTLWRSRGAAEAAVAGLMEVKKDKGKAALEGLKESHKAEKLARKASKRTRKQQKKEAKKSKKAKGIKASAAQAKETSQHIRTLLRLVLVQPALRHVLSDLFFYLEATVEDTAGATFQAAQTDLGQTSSAGQIKSDVGVLQTAIEAGAGAALGGARLVKERFEEKRLLAQDALRLDGAQRMPDGSVELGAIDPAIALKKAEESQATHADKAAEKLAIAQTLIQKAKQETQNIHAQALDTSQQIQSRKDQVLAEVDTNAASNAASAQTLNGNSSLPTQIFDAAQMATISGVRVGNIGLVQRGEARKLAIKGKDEFIKNSKDNWTPEREERLFTRTRKLFADLQGQPDYRESIIYLLDTVEKLVPVPTEAKQPGKEARTEFVKRKLDAALGETAEPIIHFLDNFAGGNSLRAVLETASDLAADTIDDAGAKNATGLTIQSFWRRIDQYVRDLLLKEGYALSTQAELDAREIRKAYNGLSREYKQKVVKMLSGIASFTHAFQRDNVLREITKHAKAFAKRLVIGKEGSAIPSKAIWNDLRRVILPYAFDRVGVLPIPRVRYMHPDFDVTIENVALQLKQLLPDTFDLKLNNDFHVDFRKVKESTHSHQIKVKIKGMGIRVHKLAFSFLWKKGIKFLDKGVGDLNIDGFGLSIYLDVPKDTSKHFFAVRKVNAKLKTLSLKVRESNHRILHAFANGMVNSFLTKRVLRGFIGYGVSLGLKELDLALLQARLNEDVAEDRITLEEIKAQMAAIRDLLRKYHEQAGELQIDFTREDDPTNAKRWEDATAVKWVKDQIEKTGKKAVVRDEWRSNAFDLPGVTTIQSMGAKSHADALPSQ